MNAHPATYPVLNPVREPATSQPAEQHFPSVDQTQAAAAAAAAAVAIPPELLAASNLTSWHNAALQWQQQAPLLAAAGHLPQDANTTALLSHFAQQLGGIPAINQMATAQHLAAQPVASASADAGALAGGMEAAQKTPGLGSESAQDEREMEGIKNRLTRRLEQNRASARRARERKKGYVSDLERQLEQMVNQKQMLEQTLASVNEINERNAAAAAAESNAAQAVAGAEMSMYQQQQQQAQREDAVAGTAPSSSPAQSQWPEGVEFDLFKDDGSPAAAATALKTWRYQFSQVSFQLKSVQANESATVQEVEAAVASAKSSVSRLMMVRSKVISRGHVLAVLSGDGFLASERPFLWLGFLRPTTVIARILEKVPSLLGPTTLALRRLHELHLRHEAAIEKALDAALHDLKVILTQEITLRVPGHDGQVAPILNSIPCQASALGSVDTIGVMLKQLQGMWTHILEVVSKELGLQQQLVAYSCMVDLLADLRSYPDLLKP